MKQTPAINEALLVAQQIINLHRHEFIVPEHILLAFFSNENFRSAVEKCADIEVMETDLTDVIMDMESVPEEMELTPEYSVQFKEMCNHAGQAAIGSGSDAIGIHHIVYGIFQLEDSQARHILESHLEVSVPDFLNALAAINEDGAEPHEKWQRFLSAVEPAEVFIGRENETEQALRILCRKNKNNILIIGGNGVGKTAFAKHLSATISSSKAPKALANLKLMELDTNRLLSGTQYRGDLEARVDEVMSSIKENGDIVIYVDSLKSLGGFNKGDDGMKDIISLLIPYFKSEDIRFIVSATPEEVKRLQTNDGTALSLFRSIEFDEPSDDQATEIVSMLSGTLATYHKVNYASDTFAHAVSMSRRYIQDRCLPDKAIDLLDEAGAYCQTRKLRKVTRQIIDKVLSDICKSDVQASSDDVKDDLYNMEERLKQKIYGQDNAIKTLTEAILMSKAGLLDSGKTIGSFLFVGPTGVGKTELSKVLAQQLHLPLHRFDMSEYSEKHSVAKLIGSPAGYVGYDDGGILTDTIRKNPHCVLLLDEIEKAHEDIYNLLLQVMDYAVISDNKGRKIDFRNVILIMTSNAGARYAHQASLGFERKTNAGAAMAKEVRKVFTPEFLNRLTSVVVFNDMDRKMAGMILDDKIKRLQERLTARKVQLVIEPEAYAKLLDEGFSTEYGAREIERTLNSRLTPLLMREILFGEHKSGFTATIKATKEGYVLES
jgi:ATP-dependent Clp protease ATP-binding subunit ClpA